MPRKRRNKLMTSLEGLFEAGSKTLGRSVRRAVADAAAGVEAELRELRKTLIRLQRTVAQGAGLAVSDRHRRPMRLCLVAGCGRKHAARGLCKNHYQQWLNRKKKEGPNAPKPGGVPRTLRGRGRARA